MKNVGQHYTVQQLHSLLDDRITVDEDRRMREHLNGCESCRLAFENLSSVDGVLRKLPLLETRPDFTRALMDRILLAPGSSFAFRVLEKMSYVFGLLIVLSIMIAAFVLTGVLDQSQVEQTKGVASGIADQVGSGVSRAVDGFTALLVQYIPFAFGKGSMGVAFFSVAVIAMLAAIDRVVGRRVLQK